MKRYYSIRLWMLATLALIGFAACEKDNYTAPSSTLTGTITHNGIPVRVRSNAVQLELWQPGYALNGRIPVYVAPDGTFSAALFNGNYKLINLRNNGPWVNMLDTIDISVSGNQHIALNLVPTFQFRNDEVQLSRDGNLLSVSVHVEKTGDRSIENITLLWSKTQLVDQVNFARSFSIPVRDEDLIDPITATLSIDPDASIGGYVNNRQQLLEIMAKGYGFFCIGVKAQGLQEMVYSQVYRIDF